MDDVLLGFDLDEQSEDDVVSQPPRRQRCARCSRPTATCYCEALPTERLRLSQDCPCISCILIYQHPNEDKRTFKSAVLLGDCCATSQSFSSVDALNAYLAIHGPRALDIAYIRTRKVRCCNLSLFSSHRDPSPVTPRPILIYSTPDSRPLSALFPNGTRAPTPPFAVSAPRPNHHDGLPAFPGTTGPFLLVVLDGTWKETSEMYAASSWLKTVPAYHLTPSVFRTCAAWDSTEPSFGLFGAVRVPPSVCPATAGRGRRGRRAARRLVTEQLREASSAVSPRISADGVAHPGAEPAGGTPDLASQPIVSPILCTAEAVAVSVETLARRFPSDPRRASHETAALSLTRHVKRVLALIAAFQTGKKRPHSAAQVAAKERGSPRD